MLATLGLRAGSNVLVLILRRPNERNTPMRHLTRFGMAVVLMLAIAPAPRAASAQEPDTAKASKRLGSVRNEVASTLSPGRQYDNIVNIGCGWASGVNFTGSYDWPSLLQSIMSDPDHLYDILTSPHNMTRYPNRYVILVKEALEARDGTSINLIDVAKTGHT